MSLPQRSLTVLVAALGGEGGGMLADWLMHAATACGFPAQATSIPGVAQRTGATTYYVEIFPARRELLGGREPVMSLTPSPGNVDVMVASELLEAGRAMQNGYVSPERTTLIASTHRIYATVEKSQMADGRISSERVLEVAFGVFPTGHRRGEKTEGPRSDAEAGGGRAEHRYCRGRGAKAGGRGVAPGVGFVDAHVQHDLGVELAHQANRGATVARVDPVERHPGDAPPRRVHVEAHDVGDRRVGLEQVHDAGA